MRLTKLLYVSKRPYYPVRLAHGGQRSTHELLLELRVRADIDCRAICLCPTAYCETYLPREHEWGALGISKVQKTRDGFTINCGYQVQIVTDSESRFWASVLSAYEEFSPSIVLTG